MNDTTNDTQSRPNVSTEPGEKGIAENSATSTQPRPNLSTEHQREGDARSPSDTLDRGQDGDTDVQGQENVEDRPNVSTVDPSDYPEQQ